MRTLITGATGFLGSHLTESLFAEGHKVHALVRPQSPHRSQAFAPAVTFHAVDAMGDNLDELVAHASPEIAFHLTRHFVVATIARRT